MIGEALFQPSHLLFLLVVLLLFFGPQKLPGLGRGMGKGIREFKDALRGIEKKDEEEEEETEAKAKAEQKKEGEKKEAEREVAAKKEA